MSKLTLFSPAKLNLTFRVLKKRPDGFHEIDSLFQAIDLCDELTIELCDRDSITCDQPQIPTNRDNLLFKALDLFRRKTGREEPVAFLLKKKIPVESGLGGGSSNAATALWGMNQLLKEGVDDETLCRWSGEIGSDVPFFFSTGRAQCRGRGEILTSLPEVAPEKLWIAKPKEGLSTPDVYRAVRIVESESRMGYFNDLEKAAFSLMPKLQKLKDDLLVAGFDHVQMTGSGTAFFCLGGQAPPSLSNVSFFPARFLFRSLHYWYKFLP